VNFPNVNVRCTRSSDWGRTAVTPETPIMKKTVLTLAIVFILASVFGQRMEYRLSFNSGLFSFAGKSSGSTTFINSYIMNSSNALNAYTNNPYGSKNGLCYGLSANVKRVTKINVVYGVDLGYEMLRSKTTVDGVYDHNGVALINLTPASGKAYLDFSFINIQPFAGYRFEIKPVHIDLTAGVDIARCLSAKEKGNAETTTGLAYNTSVDRKTITTDIRPRVQLAADYKKFGAYVGFSLGQVNYMKDYVGGTNENYSRIFRFGITYRLI